MARETVRIEGLAGVMKTLRELPPAMASKNGGPVRRALKKAAQVFLVEAKSNVRKIIDTPNAGGSDDSTGLLLLSLQSKRGKPPRGQKGESYVVSIKRNQKYPSNRQSKKGDLTATQVGRLLEQGTEKRRAIPWLRPAFEAKKMDALTTFTTDINQDLAALVKKLTRQNGVKP